MMRFSFYLLALLLFLLPFHAFFVTWFSHIFLGSSNELLPAASMLLASWKEVLIIFLGLLFCIKWIKNKSFPIKFFVFDYIFIAFSLVALMSGIFLTQDIGQVIWGLKYDFEFWILFYLVRGLVFDVSQKEKLYNVFFISASTVVVLAMVLYFFLPQDILQYFGYSTHISSFNTEKPLPMFHSLAGSETARAASTFSGPNQFGFYLMIVISFLLVKIRKYFLSVKKNIVILRQAQYDNIFQNKNILLLIIHCSLFILSLLALFLTFSRSAWLGTIIIILLFIFISLSQKNRWKFIATAFISAVFLVFISAQIFPNFSRDVLLRSASSSLHFEKSTQALSQVLKYPFGTGIGTAGPASLRSEELLTVYVPTKDVSAFRTEGLSFEQRNEIWLYDTAPGELVAFKPKNIEELKAIPVFQDIKDNYPELFQKITDLWNAYYVERIAENWHIQMFQEFGWLGGILYILFLIFLLRNFYSEKSISSLLLSNNEEIDSCLRGNDRDVYAPLGFLALSGFIVAGMFLHVFEDASSSLTLAVLLALSFQVKGVNT